MQAFSQKELKIYTLLKRTEQLYRHFHEKTYLLKLAFKNITSFHKLEVVCWRYKCSFGYKRYPDKKYFLPHVHFLYLIVIKFLKYSSVERYFSNCPQFNSISNSKQILKTYGRCIIHIF